MKVLNKFNTDIGLYHECPICYEEVFDRHKKCMNCQIILEFPEEEELGQLLHKGYKIIQEGSGYKKD